MQNPTWYNNQVHGCCNMVVIPSFPDNMFYHVYECGCWFITMVPTTLFKSVRSSSHEQSVPTCMNKPVNNHVQAGLLNHVQTCQQHCSSWPTQPCSSWPAQPCSSLSTGKNKLCVVCVSTWYQHETHLNTATKLIQKSSQRNQINQTYSSTLLCFKKLLNVVTLKQEKPQRQLSRSIHTTTLTRTFVISTFTRRRKLYRCQLTLWVRLNIEPPMKSPNTSYTSKYSSL